MDNPKNKEGELILWKYETCNIYTSTNSNPIQSEYFIWSHDILIARGRESHHFFCDGAFHNPKGYIQILIIFFKDIIIKEKIPCFFVLMSNRKEELYKRVFNSIIEILTQDYIYNLSVKTITTDTEIPLINAIKKTFNRVQRIGCWFHRKQNLEKYVKILGLLNPMKINNKNNMDNSNSDKKKVII